MQERLISGVGALVLLGTAYLACPRALKPHIKKRTIGGGLLILLAFSVIVLKTPAAVVFGWASDLVDRLLEFSQKGAEFVFGPLVSNKTQFGFIVAFQVLPTIVFFAALMSILYYVRLMPLVIRHLGRFLARTLGTSGPESFSTVADIFVGQTEAPLVIRPYLASLTRSELMACMTAGFATTAGGVLAAYVLMLKPYVPGIAGHLIACSVMCAPASLVIAKLMLPESDERALAAMREDHAVAPPSADGGGLLGAIAAGTTDGLSLALNVGAMLVAFLGLTALLNACLGWLGETLLHMPLSLEMLLGWAFAPLAWLMGIPAEDVTKVASLLGQKTVLNEFVAYTTMSEQLARDPHWLGERSRLIASYALCGFANLGSVGIQIGGYSALAPERRADIASLGLRAMVAGLMTTCLVACFAGMLV